MKFGESAQETLLEKELVQGFLEVTVEKRPFTARGNFGWVVGWIERVSYREVVMVVPFPSLGVGPVEELVQVCSVVKVLVL